MLPLFAQGMVSGTVVYYAVAIILIAAVIGVVFVITRQMGVTIPPFIVTICWIVLAAAIGILAIRFLAGLA